MPQRLAPLDQSWGNLAAGGADKMLAGASAAAQIRAQGKDALARGIQHGLASIATGIQRKRAEKREDAQIAKADARADRAWGLQLEQAQYERDLANWKMTEAEMANLQEEAAIAALSGDATAAANAQAKMQEYQTRQAALAQRLSTPIASPGMPGGAGAAPT